ncbi:MAG TPA: VOC family protein [Dermatophilaceae bacterium]|nr:VOC family protein [Dermatophilaceae bacterium]
MSRVVHFEIQADDVERAKAFYAAVFDWSYEDYSAFTGSPYWGVVTGPEDSLGINGGLMPRPGPIPSAGGGSNAFVCTVGIADYEECERRIVAAGGVVTLPKHALPGMAWQGYYQDTEGNTFGLHQPDPQAR